MRLKTTNDDKIYKTKCNMSENIKFAIYVLNHII